MSESQRRIDRRTLLRLMGAAGASATAAAAAGGLFGAARARADQEQDSMHSHVTLRVGAIRVTEWR